MENNKITKEELNDRNTITCPICNEVIAYQESDGSWICSNCGVKIKLEID